MTTPPPSEITEAFGPAPFRFHPAQEVITSPAFGRSFKILALSLWTGLGVWAYQLHGADITQTGYLWLWAAWLMMAYTVFHLIKGQTRLTAQTLEQSWIWHKKVELRDLAYVKLIRIPGLDAIVAPRLYARTLMGKFTVIYACSPAMIAEFKRLSEELKTFRSMS